MLSFCKFKNSNSMLLSTILEILCQKFILTFMLIQISFFRKSLDPWVFQETIMTNSLTYADAGVDIDKANRLVNIFVGVNSSSPIVLPSSGTNASIFSLRISKHTLRTREYPLL